MVNRASWNRSTWDVTAETRETRGNGLLTRRVDPPHLEDDDAPKVRQRSFPGVSFGGVRSHFQEPNSPSLGRQMRLRRRNVRQKSTSEHCRSRLRRPATDS